MTMLDVNSSNVIEVATTTIGELRQRLLPILDRRAYALGLVGKYDAAVHDAREMISLAPTSFEGYYRLGCLFASQGKQHKAIEAFDSGLRNLSPVTTFQATDNNKEMAPSAAAQVLLTGRKAAQQQSQKRVDFVRDLSVEVANVILSMLPQHTKAAVLYVSSTWRKRLLTCPLAWRTLSIANQIEDVNITSMLPYIAPHIRQLSLSTANENVLLRHLSSMSSGYFKRIESFHWNAKVVDNLGIHTTLSLTAALSRMCTTLTKLELNVDERLSPDSLTLTDLLIVCINLTKLVYTTPEPLMVISFDNDNSSSNNNNNEQVQQQQYLEPCHHALIDLEIEASLITRDYIRPKLRQCPHLRRLVLYSPVEDDILIDINNICANLRILGFNSNEVPTADLQKDANNGHQQQAGLRQIYTWSNKSAGSIERLIPLIRKNMDTIEVIEVDFRPPFIGNPELVDPGAFDWLQGHHSLLSSQLMNIRLPKLTSLRLYSNGYTVLETSFWKLIPRCAPLTQIYLIGISSMDRVVDMLVNSFPRLEVLHIALCNEHDFEAGFIRLYKNYANLAAAATSATSEVRENAAQTQRRQSGLLKRVFLEGCLSITDRVLSTIGDISTLTTLILYGPFPAVSSDGIKQLVRKLVNLKEITIGILATVKDDTLIGAFDNRTTPYLEIVRLQDLKSVTDYGIIIATDNIAKSLKTLTLTRCRSVTQSAVNFAKRKCTVYDYR